MPAVRAEPIVEVGPGGNWRAVVEVFEASDFFQQRGRAQQFPLRADRGRLHGVQRTITERVKYLRNVTGDRRSHDEDWARRLKHDLSRCFHSIDARHDHVHEDQIGPIPTGKR